MRAQGLVGALDTKKNETKSQLFVGFLSSREGGLLRRERMPTGKSHIISTRENHDAFIP